MNFHTLEYAVLLSVVFVGYYALSRYKVLRLILFLVASYVFYGGWNPARGTWSPFTEGWTPWYLGLIVGTSLLDYFVGVMLGRESRPRRRKLILLASLGANLGVLGVFKYYNFFAGSVADLCAQFDMTLSPAVLHMALPAGISFYTFQSMSYTIDVYRGDLEPVTDPLSFMVFVAFFAQLIAGPIVRAKDFLPQLGQAPALRARMGSMGLFLIGLGLIKKVVIADLLAVNFVGDAFKTPTVYTAAELLVAVYGYAARIYCDFSGYSDMAIGSAYLLGITLCDNFNLPYRARNLGEFWRRWHMSLSTWLRDYLYVSLNGSNTSAVRSDVSLVLTMLLGGLWHGASFRFLLWGGLHGVGLAAHRLWDRVRGPRRPTWYGRVIGICVTFHYVCLGWIFFAAPDFARAWQVLRGIAAGTHGTANVSWLIWVLLAAAVVSHATPDRLRAGAANLFCWLPSPVQALIMAACIVGVRLATTAKVQEFIYFQF